MPTAVEVLEQTTDELLNALESMARRHCDINPETRRVDSWGVNANAEALELLAKHKRFCGLHRSGRMVMGYWPEDYPKSMENSDGG